MLGKCVAHLRRLWSDRRGNITIMAALAMPVIAGSLGLGAEVASWYAGKRALQNAADSAAIAAATNATADYKAEAKAVAARYGFKDGQDGVTIAAANDAPCPGGKNECYSVVINRIQPLLLAQAVGFQGDTQMADGSPAKIVSAKAVAIQSNAPHEFCILALAGSGATEGIRANGSPDADLTGCSIFSNTASNCNGHNLLADWSSAHTTSSACGYNNKGGQDVIADPYSKLSSNIPAATCGSTYYVAPVKKTDPPLPSTNILQGLDNRTVIDICGDAILSGPVFINSGAAGTVIIIRNGSLDLKGYTFTSMEGSAVTIIFTGPDGSSRIHAPIGGGRFDYRAPSTGPWKGVAIYQDPSLRHGIDIDYGGNTPAWDITGLIYLPHANVRFSGIVNKATNGDSCFGLVVDNLLVNGTAKILEHGECPRAGLALPVSFQPSRGQLVS
jgi:hypothetical protein